MALSNVAIVASGSLSQDRIFELGSARDNILERFKLLRESLRQQQIDCHTLDICKPADVDLLMFHDIMNELDAIIGVIKANPGVRLVYLPNEPPFVVPMHDDTLLPELPVDLLFTWNDRIAGRFDHVEKLNIGQPLLVESEIPEVAFAKKRFICSIFAYKPPRISGTLFEERLRAVEFFAAQPLGIDLFGVGWDAAELPYVGAVYRGAVDNKLKVQQQYKFALAYENTKLYPGLITEKIFDCFTAGTVPIYLGAPNISEHIPAECYIDLRDYADYEALYQYLANMSESRYQDYLAAVRAFIGSPQYHYFTSSNFAEVISRKISDIAEIQVQRSVFGIKWQLFRLLVRRPGLMRNWRRFKRFFISMIAIW